MGDNRNLRHGEKALGFFSTEKGRDRANARRTIEGLSQNDQMIELLVQQTDLLRYMSERLAAMEGHLAAQRKASESAMPPPAPGVAPAPPDPAALSYAPPPAGQQ